MDVHIFVLGVSGRLLLDIVRKIEEIKSELASNTR